MQLFESDKKLKHSLGLLKLFRASKVCTAIHLLAPYCNYTGRVDYTFFSINVISSCVHHISAGIAVITCLFNVSH
jgi:hypothetical protein